MHFCTSAREHELSDSVPRRLLQYSRFSQPVTRSLSWFSDLANRLGYVPDRGFIPNGINQGLIASRPKGLSSPNEKGSRPMRFFWNSVPRRVSKRRLVKNLNVPESLEERALLTITPLTTADPTLFGDTATVSLRSLRSAGPAMSSPSPATAQISFLVSPAQDRSTLFAPLTIH